MSGLEPCALSPCALSPFLASHTPLPYLLSHLPLYGTDFALPGLADKTGFFLPMLIPIYPLPQLYL